MREFFNVCAGVLFALAFVPYIWAIVHRGVRRWKQWYVWGWIDKITFVRPGDEPAKPIKATWIIWASLDTITFAGMYAKDSINAQISSAVIMAWVVVILAFKFGLPGWRLVDKLSMLGGALGVALWVIFKDPMLGLAATLTTVFLGSWPTFTSAWEDPGRESLPAWVTYWLSCVCALIAVPQWTVEHAAQPITFFAVESVVVSILLIRKFIIADRND